jgi:hypothetical protein
MQKEFAVVRKLDAAAKRRRDLLEQAVKVLPHTKRELASKLGVFPSTMTRYLDGQRTVPPDVLNQVTRLVRSHLRAAQQVADKLADR